MITCPTFLLFENHTDHYKSYEVSMETKQKIASVSQQHCCYSYGTDKSTLYMLQLSHHCTGKCGGH
jgi:hypothetical protein